MSTNRFTQRKSAIESEIRKHIETYQGVYKKADDEDRDPTTEERLEIESEIKAIDTLKEELQSVEANIKTLEGVEETRKSLPPVVSSAAVVSEPLDVWHREVAVKTLGEQLTDSESFKSMIRTFRETGAMPEFSTGPIQLETKGWQNKATLGETAGSGATAFVTTPTVIPGAVDTLFQPLTVASLLLEGQTTASNLRYIVEGTATSGAAGVAEAGLKPESTLGFTTADEPIKKIATILPVTEEFLQDVPAIQSYINGRLTLFVKIEEERQLLRGTSGGNEVQGILTSRGVPVYAGGTAAGSKAEQLFKAMNGLRGSAFLEPEWIIIHPSDYQDIRLAKDTANQYYGGGPFLGPYGGPQGPVGASGQVNGAQDQIWNKPAYVTAAIGGAGTALVGTRSSAQVWRRGGLSVDASNSHSDFFQRNLVALRAEERLGLTVYRPKGLVEVRLA